MDGAYIYTLDLYTIGCILHVSDVPFRMTGVFVAENSHAIDCTTGLEVLL